MTLHLQGLIKNHPWNVKFQFPKAAKSCNRPRILITPLWKVANKQNCPKHHWLLKTCIKGLSWDRTRCLNLPLQISRLIVSQTEHAQYYQCTTSPQLPGVWLIQFTSKPCHGSVLSSAWAGQGHQLSPGLALWVQTRLCLSSWALGKPGYVWKHRASRGTQAGNPHHRAGFTGDDEDTTLFITISQEKMAVTLNFIVKYFLQQPSCLLQLK